MFTSARALLLTALLLGAVSVPLPGSVAHAGVPEGIQFLKEGKYAQALAEFEAMAARGDALAMVYLSMMHLRGDGVPQSNQKAFGFALQAANLGQPVAMSYVGNMYMAAIGTPRDMDRAVTFLSRAAEAGVKEAMHNLGLIYRRGTGGVLPNHRVAFKWFKQAADLGYTPSLGQVAFFYRYGMGVDRSDDAQALAYLQKGIAAGDGYSMWVMGDALSTPDLGLKEDLLRAEALFEQAAQAGHLRGWTSIADLAERRRDFGRAVAYHRKAAEAGEVRSMGRLGGAYEQGRLGLGQDLNQAISWYRKAADREDLPSVLALVRLGVLEPSLRDRPLPGESKLLSAEYFERLPSIVGPRAGKLGSDFIGLVMRERRALELEEVYLAGTNYAMLEAAKLKRSGKSFEGAELLRKARKAQEDRGNEAGSVWVNYLEVLGAFGYSETDIEFHRTMMWISYDATSRFEQIEKELY